MKKTCDLLATIEVVTLVSCIGVRCNFFSSDDAPGIDTGAGDENCFLPLIVVVFIELDVS